MRKIDKSKILSTQYKEWVEKLDKERRDHPKPKSNDRFYFDVVMNLLHCQKGVCAYTESPLVEPEFLTEDKWEGGRYKEKKPKRFGHLEHFNPELKKKKGYEWDNLFVACSDINVLKGKKGIDDILKPDSAGYEPMELLAYDTMTHCFFPNPNIDDEKLKERIRYMLKLLQLNHPTICFKRGKFVKAGQAYRVLNRSYDVYQYFTACRMVGIPVEDD